MFIRAPQDCLIHFWFGTYVCTILDTITFLNSGTNLSKLRLNNMKKIAHCVMWSFHGFFSGLSGLFGSRQPQLSSHFLAATGTWSLNLIIAMSPMHWAMSRWTWLHTNHYPTFEVTEFLRGCRGLPHGKTPQVLLKFFSLHLQILVCCFFFFIYFW